MVNRPTHPQPVRSGRGMLAAVCFMVGAAALIVLVVERYLLPASRMVKGLDEAGRKEVGAISTLLLMIVLVCLISGLILAVRPGRFFLPRKRAPRTRTSYIDAWEESARRMPTPPPDDQPPL